MSCFHHMRWQCSSFSQPDSKCRPWRAAPLSRQQVGPSGYSLGSTCDVFSMCGAECSRWHRIVGRMRLVQGGQSSAGAVFTKCASNVAALHSQGLSTSRQAGRQAKTHGSGVGTKQVVVRFSKTDRVRWSVTCDRLAPTLVRLHLRPVHSTAA